MVAVVGFALLGLMVTPVRKQVFLLVITVITNVMHCMTTTATTVQKSGSRPFKKSAFGGKKSPATPVQKMITLFSIGSRHIDGIHKLLFFYRQRRPFFTANGRFLNHAGCCRHAKHGVGGGGDDKKGNSFSDWRRYRHQKGEADNSRHGILCLYHPILYPAVGNAYG